jgi:tetrahydromethanopterin S-methyltransferase subunit F
MNKSRTKLTEFLIGAFFAVVLGVILGIFAYYVPAVLFFGLEATSKLGFICASLGIPTYLGLVFLKNKLKK